MEKQPVSESYHDIIGPAFMFELGRRSALAAELTIMQAAQNLEQAAVKPETEDRDSIEDWVKNPENAKKAEWLMDHPDYDIFVGPDLESELKAEEEEARLNSLEYENDPERSGITMLVCAQHPLSPDGTPGEIYKARLDEAIDQYERYTKRGQEVIFRIPGAVHKGDNTSLAESGKDYLIKNGIPEDIISADGTEENGTDEIVNAFSIFEQSQSKQLHIVCSENQVVRSKLACISLLNMLPYFHTATVMSMKNSQELGFEVANPRGALRFKKEDQGKSVDAEAKNRHINGGSI
ncbi:YdcF family protein [Candidatus Saccharibacteria bacterium]|nr:YdcF family protein [Candidatus Saccharibacteria bacterium]